MVDALLPADSGGALQLGEAHGQPQQSQRRHRNEDVVVVFVDKAYDRLHRRLLFFHGRREKTLPSPALGRERSNTSWCHPISAALRPFLLLLRGARRGCFHPRSSAVLARPAAVRFQPAAHLSAGGVARVTPAKSTRLLFIIGDFLPVVKAVQAVKGLLLGFTMSRQSR